MRKNYRKINTCFNCKYVIEDRTWDCPSYYCNVDNTYSYIKNKYNLGEFCNWDVAHKLEFNSICDEWEKDEKP